MKKIIGLFILLFSIQLNAQTATLDWQSPTNGVYSYSSPRATDLNNDGIKDIVLGAGRENQTSNAGVVAIDGSNGVNLWSVPTRNQIFSSPIFQDITSDGRADVFIGGRAAEFYAIDGANGNVIWEFFPDADTVNPVDSGWYNFYSPQWVPDQDNDGYADLLLANGGDYNATILDEDRPQGNLLVVSSEDGSILAQAGVPDGKETYMSPLVVDLYNNGDLHVIYGTGGENSFNSGNIYKARLADLMNNDLSQSEIVFTSPEKGFIAPPSLADLDDDSVLDIIINAYDGKVVAVNGLYNNIMWEATIEGGETNASPGIGHFNDDDVPDVFATYAIGLAPTFTDFRHIMIDGASGEIQYNESIGFFQFNSPTIADLDQDGFDEVIMTTNAVDLQSFDASHEVRIFDFNDGTNEIVYGTLDGANVNSTALLDNIDNDGMLDFIYLHSQEAGIGNTESGFFLKKLSLDTSDDIAIPWGGYLGTSYDGSYKNPKEPCDESEFDFDLDIVNSDTGCGGGASAFASSNMCEGDVCEYIWLNEEFVVIHGGQNIEGLTAGTYYLRIVNFDECDYLTQFTIEAGESNGEGIEISSMITDASDCSEADGEVMIQFLSGEPPYITNFNGAESSPTNISFYYNENLAPGTYTFSVTDAQGCTTEETIEVGPASFEVSLEEICDAGMCTYTIIIEGQSNDYSIMVNEEEVIDNTFTISNTSTNTLVIEDENGCVYEEIFETEIITSSIEDLISNIEFIQTDNYLYLNTDQYIEQWEIYNVEGKRLMSENTYSNTLSIDINNLITGVYLLYVKINERKFSQKFYKK